MRYLTYDATAGEHASHASALTRAAGAALSEQHATPHRFPPVIIASGYDPAQRRPACPGSRRQRSYDLRDDIIGYAIWVTAGQGDLYSSDIRHTAIDVEIRRMLDLHASDPAACTAALKTVLDAPAPDGLEDYDRGIQDALYGRTWIAP